MLFTLLSATALALKPIYLVAGFGQSPIYSTISEPSLYPECPADINRVLLRTATTTNSDFLNNNPQCVAKMLQVQLNETTGKVEQLPGIVTDSSPIGSSSELSATFGSIISKAKEKGYTDNVNLFSVGYNYLLHPVTSFDVYDKLKEKIEQVYTSTKEKAVIISFSQGTSFASIFLSNYSTPEWVEEYIDSVVFLAPAFAGWPSFSQLMNQNLTPFPNSDELKKSIMRMPGLHIMLPNYQVFSHRTVVYNLHEDFDQHNASYVFEFLKSVGKVDDEAERIYQANVEKYLKAPIPEPPIPSLIIYNDGLSQTVSYVINRHQNNKITSIFPTPSDSSVTSEGPEYACGNWKNTKCRNLHDSTSHSGILSSAKTIDTLFEFIESKIKPVPEYGKPGLFLASGFQGSPIYATVTDPSKAPMCPANMKNYLFYSTFMNNMYRFIDDTNSKSWVSDECRAMLTRVELNEDETGTTYAPGIHLNSSRFGEYDRLLSYTSIITRAYEEGYTHYKNLFGVGYNYMLHPLMSNEIYEELKKRIEKYYDETGQRSIVTGHSQGTSFVEIFITDYVTKEWAQKYIAGVIFYAPAFSGWGTYGRLVSGAYGSGFPDSIKEMKTSTMRMPGLHIMMPNEGVYGSKTVIKNFPNDNDQSNASYALPLLKQLGRMDETAEKIFHLTDKYRKPPLPEPPVPSLVIYNDFAGTGNGYTYNKASNTVSAFSGKGDGTVSSDGPDYACSHWKNVTCFNYHQSGIGHSNIQTTQKTIDLTFDFIEKVKHKRPLPMNETYKLEKASGNYADYNYVDINKIPSDKFTYTNNGGSKNNYPLSNVFDNNNKTYWIADTSNSDDFLNTITVTFKESVEIKAILYDTAYFTHGSYRKYEGFPTRLNVYTSSNGEEFKLNCAFIGEPVYPWTRVQFVFPTAIKCDKMKIEFDDVTSQSLSGSSNSPAVGNLIFIQNIDYNFSEIAPARDRYLKKDYVNYFMIKSSEFTAENNGGAKADYPFKNVFDNDNKTYWVADTPNSDTFTNTITVNFKNTVTLDAFLYDTAYSTKNSVRSFHGFPTKFNIYTSLKGSEFKLNTVFTGNPVFPWSRIEFVFPVPITCDKIKFEFAEITVQTMVGNSKNPAVGNIILLKHVDSPNFAAVTGNYSNNAYVSTRRIPSTEFTAETNGGEKANYPFTNVFDNNKNSYWIANTPNSGSFTNAITVTFKNTVKLEALLYDTAYATTGQSRAFHGFPTLFGIYKAIGNGEFELAAMFEGNPVYPMTRIQFVFDEPFECDKLKLEFIEVTTQKMVSPEGPNPVIGDLHLIRKIDALSYTGATGNYAQANYVKNHQISTDKFTRETNGGSKANYPFTNVFDGNDRSFWISNTENSGTFANTITVTFDETVNLEAFLYDTAYSTSGQSRRFNGFPTSLNVYKSNGDAQFELVDVFEGFPVYPWTRIQFVFKQPVQLKSLKLEFVDVTQQTMSGTSYNPVIAQLLFLKSDDVIPPVVPTTEPTSPPTSVPTSVPTSPPTEPPTSVPTSPPTEPPTSVPTEPPTSVPTEQPTSVPTEQPTSVPTSVPSSVPTIEPSVVPIDKTCNGEDRCIIEGNEKNPAFTTVTASSFTGYSFDGNGGAICLINSGVKCESVKFINCKSATGAGGGIYISNKIDATNDVTFDNLVFSECEAAFGSAAYIYSSSMNSNVNIMHSTFASNKASSSRKPDHYSFGGCAIYISAKKGMILDCSITHNNGEGGSLKIFNHFTDSSQQNVNNKNKLDDDDDDDDDDESLFVVQGCSFLIDKDSSPAVYFVRGRKGTSCEINKCTFSGSLPENYYYIEGEMATVDSPKLKVKSCKFADTADKSIDKDNIDDYLSIDMDEQDFKSDKPKDVKEESIFTKDVIILIAVAAAAVVLVIVVIVILVVVLKNKKRNKNTPREHEMTSKNYLLESSLL